MGQSQAELIAAMPDRDRRMALMAMTDAELAVLRWDWKFWARPEQVEPPGIGHNGGPGWSTWLAMAGRGFGKTRLGSEFVRDNVCGPTPLSPGRCSRVALIAETAADARDVMVQGPSGILATTPPDFRPRYVKSERCLTWPNGAIALTFSAEEPDQLRGPEHDLAWGDELAKWRYADETYDQLQFGMRVGENPRQLFTTTPRPIKVVRELLAQERFDSQGRSVGDVYVTRGSTYENAANLAPKFLRKIRDKYEGTRLGRQELRAEVLEDVPGAIWARSMFERRSAANRKAAGMAAGEKVPDMRRVVVGVDPSGTNGEEEGGDDVGIVAAGQGVDGNYYVLGDYTCNLGPAGWGRRVVETYEREKADLVVGERNYGGAMVEFTIRTVRRSINYRNVVAAATRGKVVRAEPVVSLYEQGRVRHVGSMPQLEDQMCSMTKTGYLGKGSPDRMDAGVWALSELAFGTGTGVSQGTVRGMG